MPADEEREFEFLIKSFQFEDYHPTWEDGPNKEDLDEALSIFDEEEFGRYCPRPSFIEQTIEQLKKERKGTLSYITQMLLIQGERAVPPLIKALEDENPRLRCKIAKVLSFFRSSMAFEALVNLSEDKNIDVAICAIQALGDSENKQALIPLHKFLTDQRPEIRETAKKAIIELG